MVELRVEPYDPDLSLRWEVRRVENGKWKMFLSHIRFEVGRYLWPPRTSSEGKASWLGPYICTGKENIDTKLHPTDDPLEWFNTQAA
ncbi:hypothetical protein Syun_008873 [Stephania yunnanensis]|uniref:Uncharacterized protein n=1 Tax=Stephania yunnanensis TaxID=152371 RepID=A0AAP0PQ29_9MAGN